MRDLARKRLHRLLSIAEDEEFFMLMWAIDAVQSGRDGINTRVIMTYPQEAITTDKRSRYFVHKWKIETLLNELVVTPKQLPRTQKIDRRLNCRNFDGAVGCLQALGKLENADDKLARGRVTAFREVHRITQKQFEWQRGFYSEAQLYRSVFIFGYALGAAYFERNYGLTIQNFLYFGFVLYAIFNDGVEMSANREFDDFGVSNAIRDAGLKRLCATIATIRDEAGEIRQNRSAHIG